MTSRKINTKLFANHLKALYASWNNESDEWNVDAIVFLHGEKDEELIYQKSIAIQCWLFGYEFTDMILVCTQDTFYIHTSPKKIKILEQINEYTPELPVKISFLPKTSDNNSNFTTLLTNISKSRNGKTIGLLSKDVNTGTFIEGWTKALEESTHSFTISNIQQYISQLFAVKEEQEIKCIRTAASLSSYIFKKHLIPTIEIIIDEAKEVSHSSISDKISTLMENPANISNKLDPQYVELCYAPIIQSGGKYDLRPSAFSNDDNLNFGTIICSLGTRYKNYCSNVSRTLIVDAKPDQEKNYHFLLKLQAELLKKMKVGDPLSIVYQTAKTLIQKENPSLLEHFVKNCGFGMGLEFREAYLTLTANNTKTFIEGMVFNLSIGFQDLPLDSSDKSSVYSLLLSDTVIISSSGPQILTENVSKTYEDILYTIEETENEVEQTTETESGPRLRVTGETPEERRKRTQQELANKMRAQALENIEKKGSKTTTTPSKSKKLIAYENHSQFPKSIPNNRVFVDTTREVVLLPITGILVPFHISTIKSASKNEDLLRINFVCPGVAVNFSKQSDQSNVDPNMIYIREVTIKFSDAKELNNSHRLIQELRKRLNVRNTQGAPVIPQEKLVVSSGARIPRLPELSIRPNISGKRTTGTLEAHTNGFRFTTKRGEHVDVMYKNIKHAFFQPAHNDLLVILHFHLWNPIMIGKKNSKDVQYYSEVMDLSQALDGTNRRSIHDIDEIEEEERERENRTKLNDTFHKFIRRVDDQVQGLDFDIPFREIGFYGVPFRSKVFLLPTTYCLISLVEPPFFVLTLDEVEIVHFERVQFTLRNFDMVFVWKDFSKQPILINAIPVESLETIKEWLNTAEIKYYEGPQNLNWPRIMKTIREDEEAFWREGGFEMVLGKGNESEEESSDDDDDDEFAVESDEDEEVSEESDYSENDDSEIEESEEEESEDTEEEEGLEWEELERRAKRDDKKRGSFEDKPTKRSRSGEYSEDSDSEGEKRKQKKQKRK